MLRKVYLRMMQWGAFSVPSHAPLVSCSQLLHDVPFILLGWWIDEIFCALLGWYLCSSGGCRWDQISWGFMGSTWRWWWNQQSTARWECMGEGRCERISSIWNYATWGLQSCHWGFLSQWKRHKQGGSNSFLCSWCQLSRHSPLLNAERSWWETHSLMH